MISVSIILREMSIGAVTFLLTCSLVGSLLMLPQRAEGAGAMGIVYDPTNWIQNSASAVSDSLTAGIQATLQLKELTLDGIAFAVVNLLLQQMSRDVVNWINSGFQGQPAFVQDFGSYFNQFGDNLIGRIVQNGGPEVNFLCEPFQLQIKLALDFQYSRVRDYHSRCTLTDIVGNVENFLDGDFLAGGWNGWYQITMSPYDNPYGAMLDIHEQIGIRLGNQKKNAEMKLSFGKGLLSREECVRMADDANGGYCAEYRVITPGTVIEKELNEALGSPRRRIEMADEMNEIFSALFSQLTKQALSGVGGLLGLTGSQGYRAPSGSYYDTLAEEDPGMTIDESNNPLAASANIEDRILSAYTAMLEDISDTENYKRETYPECKTHSGELTPHLVDAQAEAEGYVADATTALPILEQLWTDFQDAEDIPYDAVPNRQDVQGDIMNEYLELQGRGVLHTSADVKLIKTHTNVLEQLIDEFKMDVDEACKAYENPGGI